MPDMKEIESKIIEDPEVKKLYDYYLQKAKEETAEKKENTRSANKNRNKISRKKSKRKHIHSHMQKNDKRLLQHPIKSNPHRNIRTTRTRK